MKRTKITTEDRLFSEFIRKRAMLRVGGCERCLTPKYDKVKDDGSIFPAWKQLQCAHFYTKNNKSVRWDEDNALGLCGGCHLYFDSHHDEHKSFMIATLGEYGFERLTMRCLGVKNTDIKLVRIYLKQLLKDLKDLWK